jgi:hypothetical protein
MELGFTLSYAAVTRRPFGPPLLPVMPFGGGESSTLVAGGLPGLTYWTNDSTHVDTMGLTCRFGRDRYPEGTHVGRADR